MCFQYGFDAQRGERCHRPLSATRARLDAGARYNTHRGCLARAILQPPANAAGPGCGSGEPIARHLLERGVEVTGVDSSPEMMALFAHNFPSYSAQVADMRTLSLSRRFDGLLAWNSFFHLSHADQRGVFPVFREHSAPSAVLMFTSGPSHGGPSVASKVNHCTTLASMAPSIVRCSTHTASMSWHMSRKTRLAAASRSGWRSCARFTPQLRRHT